MHRAGQTWIAYRRAGGTRDRILPDFLIGAHASDQSAQLLSRDRGFYARGRILERLREVEVADPPVEYQFSMPDMWSRRVFLALLRRYGLEPYRYRRQRYTTVMVRVSRGGEGRTFATRRRRTSPCRAPAISTGATRRSPPPRAPICHHW